MRQQKKLEVLAVIEAMTKFDQEQAQLLKRLLEEGKTGDRYDPRKLERIFKEA
jgi:hypothetical protein